MQLMKARHIRRLRNRVAKFKTYRTKHLIFTYSPDFVEIKATSFKHAIKRFLKRKTSDLMVDRFNIKKVARPEWGDLRIVSQSGNVRFFRIR